MTLPDGVGALPAFVALDALAVLDGTRRGASVQLDDAYFDGQKRVLAAVDSADFERRMQISEESRDVYDEITVDFDALTERNLRVASERYRGLLQGLPEVQHLQSSFPETCFVVPEWLRSSGQVQYGARVYFFRDDDAPSPERIVRENVEATVNGARSEFERYQGRLHGYPDCCIEFFQNRPSDAAPPETRSVDPLVDHVDEAAFDAGPDPSTPIDDLLPTFFETPDAYAFFAREFFPEPGCERARERGVAIYDALVDRLPESLVRDYFRLNFGWSYLMARAVREGDRRRPVPGALGRDHLYSYLPLDNVLTLSRHR